MKAAGRFLVAVVLLAGVPIIGDAQEDSTGIQTLDSIASVIGAIDDGMADSMRIRYYDSSAVEGRSVDPTILGRYRADDDFNYDRFRETRTLWDRISQWISDLLSDVLPGNMAGGVFLFLTNWFPYIAVAVLVGLLVWILMRGGINSPFSRKSAEAGGVGDFHELDEDIETMEFDGLIENAVAAGHYRRAVRLLYLKCLRDLSVRGLITIAREKSNADYLRELSSGRFHNPFADVTLLFEYVWYGDIPVNAATWPRIRERFATFNSILQVGR